MPKMAQLTMDEFDERLWSINSVLVKAVAREFNIKEHSLRFIQDRECKLLQVSVQNDGTERAQLHRFLYYLVAKGDFPIHIGIACKIDEGITATCTSDGFALQFDTLDRVSAFLKKYPVKSLKLVTEVVLPTDRNTVLSYEDYMKTEQES